MKLKHSLSALLLTYMSILGLQLITLKGNAQIDRQFWFAVPDVTSRHADRPIYLRIATLSNPSVITVSIPAASTTLVSNVNIAANTSYSLDLTPYINNLENSENTINTVLNKGLLISATEDITAYYEVLGTVTNTTRIVNTEIFSLKGSNALGTDFYVPFQNLHQNVVTDFWGGNIRGKSSIDIVATEDNTEITITPTKAYRVGASGSSTTPVTIILNRGQTYSMEAAGPLGNQHLAGTHVMATKPIAITMKDDSIIEQGLNGYDLTGDQIIPINKTGIEYIIFGGYAFICATEDNTTVYINNTQVATLNKGQTYSSDLRSEITATYITTDKNAYLHHLIEIDGEMATSIIPPLICTGSRSVSVNRSSFNYGEIFYLYIIVQSGSEDDFVVKNSISPAGSSTVITASNFVDVTATNGEWKFTALAFSDLSQIPLGGNFISNTTGIFHLGILNGKGNTPGAPIADDVPPTGFRYGYFTDFGSLKIDVSIPDECVPSGESITINPGTYNSYLWHGGQIEGLTTPTVDISESGNYSIEVTNVGGCEATSDFTITLMDIPEFSLGPDTAFCNAIEGYTLRPVINNFDNYTGETYMWQDGSTNDFIDVNTSGLYILQVTNACGTTKDTMKVSASGVQTTNLFTPNGDKMNDTFELIGLNDVGDWELKVFNRWGQQVYRNDHYQNDWNGNNIAEGVYYYELKDASNVCPEYKGWVHMIR